MFAYEFMANAAMAGAIVSVLAGVVGYLLVLRGEAFAGHALAHVGFTGATGAALVGVSPLAGLAGVAVLAGLLMGGTGGRLAERDVAIGIVLTLALAFGLLFLHFFTASAAAATALLFGDILGVDREVVVVLAVGGAAALILLLVLFRPLLFASLQPELAASRGVPVRLVSALFLGLAGLVTAGSVQVVGVLLVFALTVGPAAAAQRLCRGVAGGVALSAFLALLCTGAGLVLAVATDWPVSFWISACSAAVFAASRAVRPR